MKDILTLSFMPCHRIPERSLVVRGKQFPLCFRCMGILVGMLIGIPFVWLYFPSVTFVHFVYAGILIIPLLADGYTQKWMWRTSTNSLRLLTGLLCGIGLAISIILISKVAVRALMVLTGS
ncbi:DUF2085 domain-containing protein [Rossellomorea aquimaris]|uniref:DUF2085 domain-containing protein n=1 Tax=Rossellomorea aquimaris TaxID=189382 RepID=UPI000A5967A0|nr:DUF2085 domain-containing protein [Rossellomorea aquimaris]